MDWKRADIWIGRELISALSQPRYLISALF